MSLKSLIKILLAITCLFSMSAFAGDLDDKLQTVVDRDRIKYDLPGLMVTVKRPEETNSRIFFSNNYSYMLSDTNSFYEIIYAYNRSENFYVVIAYNTRPNQQEIFLEIYNDIVKVLLKYQVAI